mgnify:CR=1 FL=1
MLAALRSMQVTLLPGNLGYTPSYKRTDLTDALHIHFGFHTDIEFISKEILLMKNGRLIDKASPEQLQAKIQGKVFEMSVGQQELEEVKEKFEISNLFRKDGQIIVRVVTQKRPEGYDEIREAAPTLEDVYLYEFEVKGAMHNNAVRKIAGT